MRRGLVVDGQLCVQISPREMARGTLAAMERRAKVIARKKGRTAVLEARRQVSIPFNSPQCDRKPLPPARLPIGTKPSVAVAGNLRCTRSRSPAPQTTSMA